MASMRPRLPPADTEAGDRHNVLSIDGGGVRGMIPATVLAFLEQKLNDRDPTAKGDARIADYLDLIAGTSTGGILTSMLATPDQDGSLRSVDKICELYLSDAGQIFPQQSQDADTVPAVKEKDEEPTSDHPFDIPDLIWKLLPESLRKLLILLNALKGPMYDGQALRNLAAQHFQDKRISETATEIFLTSFDINNRHPINFSTYQGRTDPTRDVLVKDACISTSAAPVYLPPYYFTDQAIEYNAIDGGIAANNPAMASLMSLVHQSYTSQNTTIEDLIRDIQRKKRNGPPFPVQMLSLGCGEGERISYSAQENWPAWQWMFYPSTRESPLLNFLMEAGPDMVHVQTQLVFQFLNGTSYPNGYLRVQEYNLPDKNAAMDNGSPENMKELEEIAAQLIKENAKTVNPITGETEDMRDSSGNVITNEEALEQFAMSLVKERNKRLDRAMSKVKK